MEQARQMEHIYINTCLLLFCGSHKRSITVSELLLHSAQCAFPTSGFMGSNTESLRNAKLSIKEVWSLKPGKQDNCWLLLLRVLARAALLLQDLSYTQLKVSLQTAQPWMQEHIFLSKFPFCFNNTYNPIFTSRDESCPSPTRYSGWRRAITHIDFLSILSAHGFFFLSAISSSAPVFLSCCSFQYQVSNE